MSFSEVNIRIFCPQGRVNAWGKAKGNLLFTLTPVLSGSSRVNGQRNLTISAVNLMFRCKFGISKWSLRTDSQLSQKMKKIIFWQTKTQQAPTELLSNGCKFSKNIWNMKIMLLKKILTLNNCQMCWKDFFISLCSRDGEKYRNSTLKAMCAALKRYFMDTRQMDIVQDKRFNTANSLFLGLMKENKAEGCSVVLHKQVFTENDSHCLQNFFLQQYKENFTPKHLQEMHIFNLVYYMGRRGCENLCLMTKSTFTVDSVCSVTSISVPNLW